MKPVTYHGEQPFLFASYSHKDTEIVFQILNELHQKGYRLWYDEGIIPGSEWPEEVASHLYNSALLVAFISNNSMQSENCRREINFALSKNKPFLSIILEKTEIPLGIELQLSTQQNIIRYNFETWEGFIQKILACPHLARCKGEIEEYRSNLYKADAYHELKEYDHELDALLAEQKKDPNNLTLLIRISSIHRLLGNDQEAIAFYDKAKAVSPRTPAIYHGKGKVYMASGDYTAAKPLFKQALDLFEVIPFPSPADVAACYGDYALCLGKSGDIRNAKKNLIQARKKGLSEEKIHTICETLNIDPKFLNKRLSIGK